MDRYPKMAVIKAAGLTGPAHAIAKISNPCLLSIIILLAIAVTSGERLSSIAVWSAIVMVFLVVIPLIYIYLRISSGKGDPGLRTDPTRFLKRRPRIIIVLGIVCGLPCGLALAGLAAPSPMLQTLAALLITACLIALINLHYRASFHLSANTGFRNTVRSRCCWPSSWPQLLPWASCS
jgi:hypothetical protein